MALEMELMLNDGVRGETWREKKWLEEAPLLGLEEAPLLELEEAPLRDADEMEEELDEALWLELEDDVRDALLYVGSGGQGGTGGIVGECRGPEEALSEQRRANRQVSTGLGWQGLRPRTAKAIAKAARRRRMGVMAKGAKLAGGR